MEQKFDEKKYLKLYDELRKEGLFTPEGLSTFKNLKLYLIDCGERFENRGRLYSLLMNTWGLIGDVRLDYLSLINFRPIASYIPFTPSSRRFKEDTKELEERLKIANQLEKACVFMYQ